MVAHLLKRGARLTFLALVLFSTQRAWGDPFYTTFAGSAAEQCITCGVFVTQGPLLDGDASVQLNGAFQIDGSTMQYSGYAAAERDVLHSAS